MDPASATIVGAVVGATAVVAAQFLTARASWKIERVQRLADRWTALLAAGHHASLSIGQVARAPMDRKEEAKGFDKVVMRLDDLAQTKQWEPADWRLHRDTLMNDQLDLVR